LGIEGAELNLEILIGKEERVLHALLRCFKKYTFLKFEFSESMECDLSNLKDKAPDIYKYLEGGYEYFVNRLDGGEFLEIENEISEETSEVENVVMVVSSNAEEVLGMNYDYLECEYAKELFAKFWLKENLESLLKGGLTVDYVRVLECLKTQLDSEERSTYEKVVGFSFRRQIVECELTDEYKVLLKDIYNDVFGMEFDVYFEEIEEDLDNVFVAPHSFIFPKNVSLTESEVLDVMTYLGAEYVKADKNRKFYILEFAGENIKYYYNPYWTKNGGHRIDHLMITLKNHPNSLELLSRKDADKICAAYENIGYNVTYK
jgi:hypothetical protein